MNNTTTRVRTRLEIPYFSTSEAKSRGIDPELSRLILQYEGGLSDSLAEIAKFVWNLFCAEGDVGISAIGEFVRLDSILKEGPGKKLVSKSGSELAIASDESSIRFLLENWKAEQLVMFSLRKNALLESDPRDGHAHKWWQFSNRGEEAEYLQQLDQFDPFVFFSETRVALEVVGSTPVIGKLIDRAIAMAAQGSLSTCRE